MNKVYLDKDGRVFLNGNEVKNVPSITMKTDWAGTTITIELSGEFKSDYCSDVKQHFMDGTVME